MTRSNTTEKSEFFAVRTLPHIIESGKREIQSILGMDIVRRFLPSLSLPLIKDTGRY
jgi:hypothetical protein